MTALTDYADWLKHGMDMGWVGPEVYVSHDGIPTSEEEDARVEEGGDPCLWVIRVYESPEHRKNVEDNHSPSVWRR